MILSPANADDYLHSRSYLTQNEHVDCLELSGGVSNMVIRVIRHGGDDLVLKQVRERLNVAEPWYCSVERIWREIEILRECERLLGNCRTNSPLQIGVPQLLFEDRKHYLYAMSAAPFDHIVWKHELLSGVARSEVAESCGTLLGALHAGSWHDASLASQLNDRQYFDDLRLDPYYRQVARVHGDLAPAIDRLIDSVWAERHCLVHGDFSPKNLLVFDNRLMLIDFEVGHYGDPAFDLGFFLSHLILKAFYHSPAHTPFLELIEGFWLRYRAEISVKVSTDELNEVIERGILNFAGCVLARLDGKSRVDYLHDETRRDALRNLCRDIFASPPKQWSDVICLVHPYLLVTAHPSCSR